MRSILLPLLLCAPILSGCVGYRPPEEIRVAVGLIHSASQDISKHNLELSRERLGQHIADLKTEESKRNPDPETLRSLRKKIAMEQENIDALKELPLALGDLHEWAKE